MDYEDSIAIFCSITGADVNMARQFLEVANGDIDQAVSLYMDNNPNPSSGNDYGTIDITNEDVTLPEEDEYNSKRIYTSQEIYRPKGAGIEKHSVGIFDSSDNEMLAAMYRLPEELSGPYLLEAAREQAAYNKPRKWVLLCLFKKEDFSGGEINSKLFHNQTVKEIMLYNFVIVQHFISTDENSEGYRLQSMYKPDRIPFLAIINPLSGQNERTINDQEFNDLERFIECITSFLIKRDIESLPDIPPPSIVMKTSNHKADITPANTKSLREPPAKRRFISSTPIVTPRTPSAPQSPAPSTVGNKYHETVNVPQNDEFVDISTEVGPAACRLRLRLPGSQNIICVLKSATLSQLVSYIRHTQKSVDNKAVELLTGNPPVSLMDKMDQTLDDLKLNGTAVIVRILENDNGDVSILYVYLKQEETQKKMINTSIYRRDRIRRVIVVATLVLSVFALFLRPARVLSSADLRMEKEVKPTIEDNEGTKDEVAQRAEEISVEELYLIRTRSNEYIIIVDARSRREFDEGHISGAVPLEQFEQNDFSRFPKIRVFFYSNNNERSQEVANRYASEGIRAVYLKGGLTEWIQGEGSNLMEQNSE